VSTPVITVTRAAIGYEGRAVLRDVSLTVTAGEVVAVLGANGSGKSTLIRSVLGLVPLSSGSVELFDQPARRFRQWHRIGYVPQRLGAGGGVPASVREVVAAGPPRHPAATRPRGPEGGGDRAGGGRSRRPDR